MAPDVIAEGLSSVPGVRGRFESVDAGQPFTVLVDYAHTPDGLTQALQGAREFTSGRLLVVFGAGGDRDHEKRPLMGAAAARLADLAVVTSDNPRSEDPDAIIEQVVAGVGDRSNVVIEPDRAAAIATALAMAQPGDVVLIAGKGHERGQEVAGRLLPFDDVDGPDRAAPGFWRPGAGSRDRSPPGRGYRPADRHARHTAAHQLVASAGNRSADPRGRSPAPSDQGRHADHGRRGDHRGRRHRLSGGARRRHLHAPRAGRHAGRVWRGRGSGCSTTGSRCTASAAWASTSGPSWPVQLIIALAFAVSCVTWLKVDTHLSFTRYNSTGIDLGKVGWVILAVLVIVGCSNAVNLTDGLDGLAAGSSIFSFAAFTVIGFYQLRHFAIYRNPAALDEAAIAAAMIGACAGFLWFNAAPARIFMGDTGSLGIGTAIAILALLENVDLLLLIIGGLFVIEALSVIIQVASFQLFRRRVFRMAPIHHHFELLGWPETTVIIRFWILAGLCTALALGAFYADFLSKGGTG